MQRQQGFSLIEVLITMLIVSIGLLGIAGIIVTNLKHNQSSYARTQASLLVSDIVDRMRANRAAAETAPSPY
ncbi:MAG: type IV pilus modification protein PilV, partial [Telluria sp.]